MKTNKPAWSVVGPMVYGFAMLSALVLGFGAWSVFTTINGAIVTSGQIEVEQNRQVVQHPDGGVVDEILVTEGQAVKAGDVLLRLDGSQIHSEFKIVEGQFYEIMARSGRLEAERDDLPEISFGPELVEMAKTNPEVADLMEGQRRLFIARIDTENRELEQIGKRRGQIESQIEGIEAQRQALVTQIDLIKRERADQQKLLDKGLAQASRVMSLEREEANLSGDAGELLASRAQAEGRITESEIEALRIKATRREEANTQLRDLGYRQLELAERRRALAEQIGRLEVRAPVSGIVLGLQVTTPKSVLRPADPVLYLIPQDRPLVLAVQVAPIHIDQVHVGQPVHLVFPSFSSRTTPQLNGHVAVVSADSMTDNRTQASFYRAEIVLDPGEISRLEGLTLLPGMPVEAFIETDSRTPLAYLVKPFTDYFSHAFRES